MDFDDVMEDIVDAQWFAPHFEFRFPKVGQTPPRGASIGPCAMRWSPGM